MTMVEGRPDESVDLDTMLDLATPWSLFVAATLHIPQLVAAGHHEVGDLSAAAGCDTDALHALLSYLASTGVFVEEPAGRFSCNKAADQLGAASFLDLDGIGGRMAHAWATLLTYVRTGTPAYHTVFGLPFWEDLAAHPEVAAEFDELMGPAGHGVPDYDVELIAGWDQVRTVVDVGGGTGSMLMSLLRRHPGVRGILVDLPGTVARAAPLIKDSGVADRTTATAQSFFDPLPAGADLYLLKNVLNDWPDEPTVAILRRCAEAARDTARVVVLGGVSPDAKPHPLAIDMLVAGGKMSTLTQFRELASRAGLQVVAAGDQPSGHFVVECTADPAASRCPASHAPASQDAMSHDEADARHGSSLAHGQVCYLQIPSSDPERSAEFYTAVFGWDIQSHAPDFQAPGLIGQWTTDRPPSRDAGPQLWICVDAIDEALKLTQTHGGQIITPAQPDGPVRILATISDPSGNLIGLTQYTGATAPGTRGPRQRS